MPDSFGVVWVTNVPKSFLDYSKLLSLCVCQKPLMVHHAGRCPYTSRKFKRLNHSFLRYKNGGGPWPSEIYFYIDHPYNGKFQDYRDTGVASFPLSFSLDLEEIVCLIKLNDPSYPGLAGSLVTPTDYVKSGL